MLNKRIEYQKQFIQSTKWGKYEHNSSSTYVILLSFDDFVSKHYNLTKVFNNTNLYVKLVLSFPKN